MFGRRKALSDVIQHGSDHALKKTLSWPHLIALGVGAIVGTGIYTLTGVGAERAGPAVILAFAIAGAVSACAALAYTELATMIPAAGSAYTFTYASIGEAAAWIVGWSLILEYSLACSTVAVGWSGYLVGWIQSAGVELPQALLSGPHAGGIINLPAVLVALAVMGMLIAGTRESATLNIILVIIKLVALGAFIAFAMPAFNGENLQPFMPYGFGSTEVDGVKRGVMAAAAIVFFAFYGFDAVATSAEETKNPKRDLTIGILGSMAVCTLLYMLVAVAAVGAIPYQQLANSPEPLALGAFVAFAMPAFDGENLKPFMPYGFGSAPDADGVQRGVMAAAAIVFFAFYGFDAVATSAEEAKNPKRDLTIGIIGSMAVCTLLYMLVAVAAIGALPHTQLANSPEPLALVLRTLNQPVAAHLVALAAIIALPSVILVMMYGQSRIFFVMARDGLLPRSLAKVSPRTGAPTRITILTGLSIAAVAGVFRLDEIAELANAGTLLAFISVGACLMILRRTAPDAQRLFRSPAPFLVGTLAILGCLYLLFSLPGTTLVRFGIWNLIGLCIYFAYSRRHSLMARAG